MNKKQHNIALLSFLSLVIVIGIIWQFFPLTNAQARLDKIPLSGPDFSGENIPVTPQELEYLPHVNIIKRLYTVGDEKYFIYVLDGTANRHAVHDPTYCFAGGGWTVINTQDIPFQNGSASIYTLQKGDQTRRVLLWFTNGKTVFASPWRYWWETTLRRLTLGSYGQEPVLVVVQPLTPGEKNWKEFFDQFPQIILI